MLPFAMKTSLRHRKALTEHEEDSLLSAMADRIHMRTKKWISHEEFWSKVFPATRRDHRSKIHRDAK